MSEFLLELFCEEIPARMQARAEGDLSRLISDHLKTEGLSFERLETLSGPRRLALVLTGVPVKTADVSEERKGPRVGAPDKAVEGFLRGAGLASLDQCETREDKKGAFYVALIERPGRPAAEVLAEAVKAAVEDFPWPKSMKFGEGDRAQRWVRPLHRIVALLDGAVIPLSVFGIDASNLTEGHRVHNVNGLNGERVFAVTSFADYVEQLRKNGVEPHRGERRARILQEAREVSFEAGLELVEDQGLLEEVTGLAEHPVAILGDMDPDFLDLPDEVIALSMKVHQKYFAVRDPKTGELAAKFVMIANQKAPDGGEAIARGASRVLSARLADARHFWDLDRKTGLAAMAPELSKVTFHEKLGTVADKVERVAALARELAPSVGADPGLAETAARLAKADLVSQMVYEFPELQGEMGRYYALQPQNTAFPAKPQAQSRDLPGSSQQGPGSAPEPGSGLSGDSGLLEGVSKADRQAVADAIRDHYKPQGPGEAVPAAPVSVAVALADKLDTLVGFWAIDEKPTGSKDPFALRRAALGIIRMLLEGSHRLLFQSRIPDCYWQIIKPRWDDRTAWWFFEPDREMPARFILLDTAHSREQVSAPDSSFRNCRIALFNKDDANVGNGMLLSQSQLDELSAVRLSPLADIVDDLLSFFADRLKVHLKDDGVRHDVIDAVFAPRLDGTVDDDLVRVTNKSKALQAFLETDDGAALQAGYTRAANILKAEEKKDGATAGDPDEDYFARAPEIAERALIEALVVNGAKADAALKDEDFEAAMRALAALREPVDAFFESVTVNHENPILRRNRLALLARIRRAVQAVADFDRLEG